MELLEREIGFFDIKELKTLVISAFDKEIQNKTQQKEKNRSRLASVQITDKGFRTTVLSPLSYFTRIMRYGII